MDGLRALQARSIGLIAPYMKPLTQMVVDYLEVEGIAVQDFLALEIPDNLEVAAQNPMNLVDHVKSIDTSGVDAVVLSACVQMPSLQAIQVVEDSLGVPVLSASVATALLALLIFFASRALRGIDATHLAAMEAAEAPMPGLSKRPAPAPR